MTLGGFEQEYVDELELLRDMSWIWLWFRFTVIVDKCEFKDMRMDTIWILNIDFDQ